MTSLAHRIRRTAAIVVSLAAGSTLAPAGTAAAQPGRPSAVANRATAAVSVVDPRQGIVVDTLTTGANPNHVQVAHGAAYVVAKSGSGPEGQDVLHRFPLGR